MVRPDPDNVLQNVITYLCFKAETLSQTKLMKLAYLSDVYHMDRYDKRMTDVPFKHWHYGPFSEVVNSEIEQLCGVGVIKQELYQTRSGFMAEVPKPDVNMTTVALSKEAINVLDEIISEWGTASTEEVVSFSKTTLPFVGTPFGEEIDFSRMHTLKKIVKEKKISFKDAEALKIENNESLMKSLDRAKKKVKAQGLP